MTLYNLVLLLAIMPFLVGFSFKSEANPIIKITTNQGDIQLELYQDKAPDTVKNFLSYIQSTHYDNTIFHRVIPGFVIQGGGYTADFSEKPTQDPIKNEATNQLSNARGTIAMARTSDINSATSQFFINLSDNIALDHRDESRAGYGYCVFGKVISGLETVDAIAKTPTHTSGYHSDVPVDPVIIESVRLMPSS